MCDTIFSFIFFETTSLVILDTSLWASRHHFPSCQVFGDIRCNLIVCPAPVVIFFWVTSRCYTLLSHIYKFEKQHFRYGGRNEPKFGTHVRIDTLTLKKLKKLTHPTPGGFSGLLDVVRSFVRATAVLAAKRAERHDRPRTTTHHHARPRMTDHACTTDHARRTAHDRPRPTTAAIFV